MGEAFLRKLREKHGVPTTNFEPPIEVPEAPTSEAPQLEVTPSSPPSMQPPQPTPEAPSEVTKPAPNSDKKKSFQEKLRDRFGGGSGAFTTPRNKPTIGDYDAVRPPTWKENVSQNLGIIGESFSEAPVSTTGTIVGQGLAGFVEGAYDITTTLGGAVLATGASPFRATGRAWAGAGFNPKKELLDDLEGIYNFAKGVKGFLPDGVSVDNVPGYVAREIGKEFGLIGAPEIAFVAIGLRNGRITKEVFEAIHHEVKTGNHVGAKAAIRRMKESGYIPAKPLPRRIRKGASEDLARMYDILIEGETATRTGFKGLWDKRHAKRLRAVTNKSTHLKEEARAILGEMAAGNFVKIMFAGDEPTAWHVGVGLTAEIAGAVAVPWTLQSGLQLGMDGFRAILKGANANGWAWESDDWWSKVDKWLPAKHQKLIDMGVSPQNAAASATFVDLMANMGEEQKAYIREAYTMLAEEAAKAGRKKLGPDASQEEIDSYVAKYFNSIAIAHKLSSFSTIEAQAKSEFAATWGSYVGTDQDRVFAEHVKNLEFLNDELGAYIDLMPGADVDDPLFKVRVAARDYGVAQLEAFKKLQRKLKFQKAVDVQRLLETADPNFPASASIDEGIIKSLGEDSGVVLKETDELLSEYGVESLELAARMEAEGTNLAENARNLLVRNTIEPELASRFNKEVLIAGRDHQQGVASRAFDEIRSYSDGTLLAPNRIGEANLDGDQETMDALLRDVVHLTEASGIDFDLQGLTPVSIQRGKGRNLESFVMTSRDNVVKDLDDDVAVQLLNNTLVADDAYLAMPGKTQETYVAEYTVDINDLKAKLADPETSWEAQAHLKVIRDELTGNVNIELPSDNYKTSLKDLRTIESAMRKEAFKLRTRMNSQNDAVANEMDGVADRISQYFDAAVASGDGEDILKLRGALDGWKKFARAWKSGPALKATRKTPSGDERIAPSMLFEETFLTNRGGYDAIESKRLFDEMFEPDSPERSNAENMLRNAFHEKLIKELGTGELNSEKIANVLANNKSLIKQYGTIIGGAQFDGALGPIVRAEELKIEVDALRKSIVDQRKIVLEHDLNVITDNVSITATVESGSPLAKMFKAGSALTGDDILRAITPEKGGGVHNIDIILQSSENPEAVRNAIKGVIHHNITKEILSGGGFTFRGGGLKDINELNSEVLHTFLQTNDEILDRLYFPEELEDLRSLDNLVRVLGQDTNILKASNVSTKGMTIEGALSRGYAIMRGVVSVRWVMTEAAVRALRKGKGRMLLQAANDTALAHALKRIMIDGKEGSFQDEFAIANAAYISLINAGEDIEAERFKKDVNDLWRAGKRMISYFSEEGLVDIESELQNIIPGDSPQLETDPVVQRQLAENSDTGTQMTNLGLN